MKNKYDEIIRVALAEDAEEDLRASLAAALAEYVTEEDIRAWFDDENPHLTKNIRAMQDALNRQIPGNTVQLEPIGSHRKLTILY